MRQASTVPIVCDSYSERMWYGCGTDFKITYRFVLPIRNWGQKTQRPDPFQEKISHLSAA